MKVHSVETDTSSKSTVMVVEDEFEMRCFIRNTLDSEGYMVIAAASSGDGLELLETAKPRLILLDMELPDSDGVSFIAHLRRFSDIPVLVVSGHSTSSAKITALNAGADDYVTKPFNAEELLARVRAQLRRPVPEGAGASYDFGNIRVEMRSRTVVRSGQPVHLTPTEFRLLCVLLRNAGRVLTSRHLLREVWGPGHSEDGHYLRAYAVRLRRKIEENPARPRHLLTELGIGYRFVFGT